jgi:hypothetical protein
MGNRMRRAATTFARERVAILPLAQSQYRAPVFMQLKAQSEARARPRELHVNWLSQCAGNPQVAAEHNTAAANAMSKIRHTRF